MQRLLLSPLVLFTAYSLSLHTTPIDNEDIQSTDQEIHNCQSRKSSCGLCISDPNCGYCQEWLGEGTSPAFDISCIPGTDNRPNDIDRQCRTINKNWFYEDCNGFVNEDSGSIDQRFPLLTNTGTIENPPPLLPYQFFSPPPSPHSSATKIKPSSSKKTILLEVKTGKGPAFDPFNPMRDPTLPILPSKLK